MKTLVSLILKFQTSKFDGKFACSKQQQSYHGDNEGEKQSRQFEILYFYCENHGLAPIYEVTSGEESNLDQELDICSRVYEFATNNKKMVCVSQELQGQQASLRLNFDHSLQKRMKS